MARKKHLINVHTSTGTTAPTEASLYLGEIAVQHTPNDPALWIKVGSAETSTEYEKFIGLTEITNIFNMSQILGSGYTYSGIPYVNSATTIADAYSALTRELIDDELVTAAAINDLNNRIPEPVDLEPLSASVVTNKTNIEIISAWVEDNELVTAAALNNLNDRVGSLSGLVSEIDIEPLSASVVTNVQNINILSAVVGENELVTAAALNDLNGKIEELSGNSSDSAITEDIEALSAAVVTKELVIAASLNDLNDRINDLSDESDLLSQQMLTGVTQNGASVVTNNVAEIVETSVSTTNGATSNAAAAAITGITTGGTKGHRLTLAKTRKIFSASTSDSALTVVSAVTSWSAQTTILGPTYSYSGLSYIFSSTSLADAYSALTKELIDDEKVTSAALNDLNDRVNILSANSSGDYVTTQEFESHELVAAAAFNDLNDRINTLSANSSGDYVTTQEFESHELVAAAAFNDLNSRIIELSGSVADVGEAGILGSSYTYSGLPYVNSATTVADAYSALTNELFKDEKVTSAALNDLNDRVNSISAVTSNVVTADEYDADEEIIAEALNDLNDRIIDLSGDSSYHGSLIQVLSGLVADISGNTGGGGGGGLTGVTYGGTNATVTNQVAAIPTASTSSFGVVKVPAQATSYMTNNNGTIGVAVGTGSTQVAKGSDFAAHSGSTTIHITSTERTRWQNAWTSGVSAYTLVNNLSAVTVTGVSAGGTNVTVTNKVAAIPTASTSAFGVVKIPAQGTSYMTNNAGTIGVAVGNGANQVAKGSDFAAVSAATTAHTGNSTIHVPAASAANNGKIPVIRNGAWVLEGPVVSVYNGQSTPSSSLGNDGDIYLQTS